MPKNRIQFQEDLWMPDFVDRFGTEKRCEQRCAHRTRRDLTRHGSHPLDRSWMPTRAQPEALPRG